MLYLTITQDSDNVCHVIQSGPKTLMKQLQSH